LLLLQLLSVAGVPGGDHASTDALVTPRRNASIFDAS
jgi:hypothetical protein